MSFELYSPEIYTVARLKEVSYQPQVVQCRYFCKLKMHLMDRLQICELADHVAQLDDARPEEQSFKKILNEGISYQYQRFANQKSRQKMKARSSARRNRHSREIARTKQLQTSTETKEKTEQQKPQNKHQSDKSQKKSIFLQPVFDYFKSFIYRSEQKDAVLFINQEKQPLIENENNILCYNQGQQTLKKRKQHVKYD